MMLGTFEYYISLIIVMCIIGLCIVIIWRGIEFLFPKLIKLWIWEMKIYLKYVEWVFKKINWAFKKFGIIEKEKS